MARKYAPVDKEARRLARWKELDSTCVVCGGSKLEAFLKFRKDENQIFSDIYRRKTCINPECLKIKLDTKHSSRDHEAGEATETIKEYHARVLWNAKLEVRVSTEWIPRYARAIKEYKL